MTTNTSQALWPDDEQESLFPDSSEPTPPTHTPGSAAAVSEQRAVSVTGWAPEFATLVPLSLADLFRLKAEHEIRIGHQTTDIDAAVFALTPADGWPGKNAEAREHAAAIARADAPHIAKMETLLRESVDTLTRVKAEINAREAELDEQKRMMNRTDSDLRAREIVLRSAELDHARAVFNATHANTDH